MAEQARRLMRLLGDMMDCSNEDEALLLGLEGMCRMLGAQVGIAARLNDFFSGGAATVGHAVEFGWDSQVQRELAVRPYFSTGCWADPSARQILLARAPGQAAPLVTVRRSDLVSDAEWYGSQFYNEARGPAHIDHLVHSIARSTDGRGSVSGLTFVRGSNEADFSSETLDLIALFHDEALALWRRHRQRDQDAFLNELGLTPRERQTAQSLLQARSEAQIAGELSISVHTCHQYVQAIYRKSHTRSRAEFLSLALRRLGRTLD